MYDPAFAVNYENVFYVCTNCIDLFCTFWGVGGMLALQHALISDGGWWGVSKQRSYFSVINGSGIFILVEKVFFKKQQKNRDGIQREKTRSHNLKVFSSLSPSFFFQESSSLDVKKTASAEVLEIANKRQQLMLMTKMHRASDPPRYQDPRLSYPPTVLSCHRLRYFSDRISSTWGQSTRPESECMLPYKKM